MLICTYIHYTIAFFERVGLTFLWKDNLKSGKSGDSCTTNSQNVRISRHLCVKDYLPIAKLSYVVLNTIYDFKICIYFFNTVVVFSSQDKNIPDHNCVEKKEEKNGQIEMLARFYKFRFGMFAKKVATQKTWNKKVAL